MGNKNGKPSNDKDQKGKITKKSVLYQDSERSNIMNDRHASKDNIKIDIKGDNANSQNKEIKRK